MEEAGERDEPEVRRSSAVVAAAASLNSEFAGRRRRPRDPDPERCPRDPDPERRPRDPDPERLRPHRARRRRRGGQGQRGEDHGARRDAQGATHGGRSGDGRAAVRLLPAGRAEDPVRRRPVPTDARRGVRGLDRLLLLFVLILFIL